MVPGLTPELYNIGQTIVRRLDGTTDDYWGYMDDTYDGRALTNAEAQTLALFVDSKLGRCSDCEHMCPLSDLQGEVEGGTCYSCGGERSDV